MSSVTGRIKQIKQPYGGYISPSRFEETCLNDGLTLNAEENIHASLIGMAVDYMSRKYAGEGDDDAFNISFAGAEMADILGKKDSMLIAWNLYMGIRGLDDDSIINACKLVTFDVWYRNTMAAMMTNTTYKDVMPNKATIENIRILINRSLKFFETYGDPVCSGFTFAPVKGGDRAREKWVKSGKGNYGGYTVTVDTGDGDFLTEDTLWDFKVSKSKPTSSNTLQLLMYWIMGQHSGQEIFKNITKLGIFNITWSCAT